MRELARPVQKMLGEGLAEEAGGVVQIKANFVWEEVEAETREDVVEAAGCEDAGDAADWWMATPSFCRGVRPPR